MVTANVAVVLFLTGCEYSKQPIVRGVKEKLVQVFPLADEETQTPVMPDPKNDDVSTESELERPEQHEETTRKILNLNLPNELKYSEADVKRLFANPEPQWHKQALIGKHQTFPDFFEHEMSERDRESALDFSGKVHWDDAAEEQAIPPLNTIEGLELEISVKTR